MEKEIKSDNIGTTNKNILGVFEGECADANITNLNGLDITREVWETVFSSDDYKQGIENGWLIGYLGHPEDPGCQEFQNACIVMTEGSIDDSGKIHGKFNLVDTPVGRIVKSFIDAGVKFGISVRGAGDIIDNSVEPDTFVFRGFDLVAYPAYPESIPEFIAANTNSNKKKDRMKIFAAIKDNADKINNIESIDILQSHVAKQSKEYEILQHRKKELLETTCGECSESLDLSKERIQAVYELYLSSVKENKKLKKELNLAKRSISNIFSENNRKLKAIKSIMSSQLQDVQSNALKTQEHLNKADKQIRANAIKIRNFEKNYILASDVEKRMNEQIQANKILNRKNIMLSKEVESLKKEISEVNDSNLKYKEKVESSVAIQSELQTTIANLQTQLDETVIELREQKDETSNRDEVNKKLKKEIAASNNLVQEYQKAYADLYANVIGVYLPKVSVTASTDVSELQNIINGSLVSPDMKPTFIDSDIDFDVVDIDDSDLVTL